MKLALATLALVEATKNGKGGKHGGVDMSGERFNWKIPKCISDESLCTNSKKFTQASGSIVIDENNYKNFQNVLFEINVGSNRHISLKFDQGHSFGMEYHNKCGYDKLHIFKGSVKGFQQTNRIARFCGPKSGDKPWDGSRKIKEIDGQLAMWDYEYKTMSSEAIIAIDFDQDFNDFTGFKLDWTSEFINEPDWKSFDETVIWAEDAIDSQINSVEWKKGPTAMLKRMDAYFDRVAERSSQDKACNKNWGKSVSGGTQKLFKSKFHSSDPASYTTIEEMVSAMTKLMLEYVGNCKGSANWKNRKANIFDIIKKNKA